MPPEDASAALFAAIRKADLAAVEAALGAGANVNAHEHARIVIDRDVYDGSNTPLGLAAGAGDLAIVRRLLEAPGIDVNIEERFACITPLCSAARAGHEAVARALLAAGADPNKTDRWERKSPAALAMYSGPETLIIALLDAGTDLAIHGSQLAELAAFYKRRAVLDWLKARRT